MYWNNPARLIICFSIGLIVTWDVLKQIRCKKCVRVAGGLIVTWDVLKQRESFLPVVAVVRLIVTWDVLKLLRAVCFLSLRCGLIVTWDVLKPLKACALIMQDQINSNMRCIETKFTDEELVTEIKINSNMRCIETGPRQDSRRHGGWLIVTWDVLKLLSPRSRVIRYID